MANSSLKITPENIASWMGATGFIFPRTSGELRRFEKLYADVIIPEKELLDPEILLGIKPGRVISIEPKAAKLPGLSSLKMAARKGEKDIPSHIMDKIRKNQQKKGG